MSKESVVTDAIIAQLKHEGRLVIDLNKLMGKHYNYAIDTMRLYLEGLRRRLAVGAAPYFFEYDEDFVAAAITWTLGRLDGEVLAATSSTTPLKALHAVKAAMPAEPAEPAKPVKPAQTAAPAKPARSTQAETPAKPARSTQPT
jgi:hypothetical protein